MSKFRVGSIMRTDTPTLSVDTPVRRAVAVLIDSNAAAAPVLGDDGGLVGILTQKDCFESALHASYHREWSGRVGDHMSTDAVTVGVNDEVIRVAELFLEKPHRVFPVMDGNSCVGMLHRSEVLALLSRQG